MWLLGPGAAQSERGFGKQVAGMMMMRQHSQSRTKCCFCSSKKGLLYNHLVASHSPPFLTPEQLPDHLRDVNSGDTSNSNSKQMHNSTLW